MEHAHLEAVETSNLSEKQVISHDCSQSSPAQPVCMPKFPPRPRQRGALPRTFAEPASLPQLAGASMQSLAHFIPPSQLNAPTRSFQGTSSSSLQQQAFVRPWIPPMEEQTLPQQPADASVPFMKDSWQGQLWSQYRYVSQQGGSSSKRKDPAPLQNGQVPRVGKFSRSWHRVSPQEPSRQIAVLPRPQEQNYRPQQQGDILPPFQERVLQAPFAHTFPSPGPPFAQATAMEHRVWPPFLQMKSSFSEMWLRLEGAIQNHERIVMGRKVEMEKALSEAKILKDNALKEREELEARKAGARENTEIASKQTGKIKSVREGLEQISTDLSVQVAELNYWLQQAQEQQRVLKVLESLKDHSDASNDKNSFMFKNLHDCEVKLATMERELVGSKQTSEVLEEALLRWMSDLENVEAGCGLPNHVAKNASSNPSVVSTLLQETAEIISETKMDARASGLKGEQESLTQAAALKQPKLEVMS